MARKSAKLCQYISALRAFRSYPVGLFRIFRVFHIPGRCRRRAFLRLSIATAGWHDPRNAPNAQVAGSPRIHCVCAIALRPLACFYRSHASISRTHGACDSRSSMILRTRISATAMEYIQQASAQSSIPVNMTPAREDFWRLTVAP